jgi:BirA family biotin operon repressor/biotin-[acetyl-CoA-carboxylase] ligase
LHELGAARVVRLDSVDSTQRYAARLAAAGAADGTVVRAETQTAGRGRRGRVWQDVPGESVLMSIVARPSLALAQLPLLSLAVGVSVAEALIAAAGVDARLKWPNDVLLDRRKVAGILLERHGEAVVIGIGINVAQRAVPPALEGIATSVLLGGGRPDREAIVATVLEGLARWRERLEREGFEPVRARWMALTAMRGQQVTVDGIHGRTVGLDADGALLLDADGVITRVIAGEVLAVPAVDTPVHSAYTARNLV